jgi:transcriptional regulator with XRE-family HTH domain
MNIQVSMAVGMKLKGLNQTQLAAKLGKTKQIVSYWSNGDRLPNLDDVSSMALVFGVPVSKFIEWGEK